MNTEIPDRTVATPEDNDPPSAADVEPDPTGRVVVEVSDTQSHLSVDPAELQRVVVGALAMEGVANATVSLAIVDDATIRAINRRHLGHDWPTDVISFVLSDPDDPELSGELVVSAETAAATAASSGVAPLEELALYVVHGVLHLRGHDDSTDPARRAMRRRESDVLAALGLRNPFSAGPVESSRADRSPREAAPWAV